MLSLLITLLTLVIVLGVVWYIITLVPLPPPWRNIVMVVIAGTVAIYLLSILLGAASLPVVLR